VKNLEEKYEEIAGLLWFLVIVSSITMSTVITILLVFFVECDV
jgi:hypothetical protein